MSNKFHRLCYDNNFYNTIGLVDSILIRMIRDLLEIKDLYNNIYIYRNDDRYLASPLVVSFDNNLFVDIRFNINSRDNIIFEGMSSYINIFNNTYGLEESNYKYIMINFVKLDNDILCDNIKLYSSLYKDISDKFIIFNFNYYLGYKYFFKGIDVSNKIRWLSILNINLFSKFDYILGEDLISYDELKKLYDVIKKNQLYDS